MALSGNFSLPLTQQSFPGAATGVVGPGEVVQGVPVDKPGIVDLNGREVSLAAEPLDRLRMYPEAAARLDDRQIVVPDRHCFSF